MKKHKQILLIKYTFWNILDLKEFYVTLPLNIKSLLWSRVAQTINRDIFDFIRRHVLEPYD